MREGKTLQVRATRTACGAEICAPTRCTCEQQTIVKKTKGRNAAEHSYNATTVRQKTALECRQTVVEKDELLRAASEGQGNNNVSL